LIIEFLRATAYML